MVQLGLYFNQSRCTGCYACIVACKDWHDVPAGPASWIRVLANEGGTYPHPTLSYLFNTCFHCAHPPCVPACPVGAITKRKEDGIVVVDRETCLGNVTCSRLCLEACPHDAPQFGAESGAKMQKCDLCLERWVEGKMPICVEGCQMRALDAGPLDELKDRYGDHQEAEGFVCSRGVTPSVVFNTRKRV